MDKLKDKTGLIAIGAAAIATAGFFLYKRAQVGAAANSEDTDVTHEETQEDEILENSFFLDPKKSQAENDKIIVKWMQEQCLALQG